MSLDVYLHLPGHSEPTKLDQIFVRENGETHALSRAEWDVRSPGRPPVTVDQDATECVYTARITHNLNRMADAAGLYEVLWRPDECGYTYARDLVQPLRQGIEALRADPAAFTVYTPANGWGSYEGLVRFATAYLAACEQWPDAEVSVWR
jgi:hypothetical protein